MKYDEMICFRCAVAVAVSCLEDERPQGDAATPQSVAAYISHVLDIVFAYSGIETCVIPMVYPSCCKVPLIIDSMVWVIGSYGTTRTQTPQNLRMSWRVRSTT